MISKRKFRRVQAEALDAFTGDVKYGTVIDFNGPDENKDITTSMVEGSSGHMPVIDVDVPIYVLPSSTHGHYHLYIDKEMTRGQLLDMLTAMSKAGVVEPGYVSASRERGFTSVRSPGFVKSADSTNNGKS